MKMHLHDICLGSQARRFPISSPSSPGCIKNSFVVDGSVMGSLLVIVSAFTFSLMTFLVRAAGDRGIPSYEMMVIRCILQTLYSGYICLWLGINPFGPPGYRFWPFMRGLIGPFGESSLYFGATHIAIADATVLMFSSAVWTPFIARIMLSEPFRLIYTGAIASGFTGVICVTQPPFLFGPLQEWLGVDLQGVDENQESDKAQPGSTEYTLAALVCVFGAIAASIVYAVIRKTGGTVHHQVLVFWYGVVGTFSSIIMLYVFQGPFVNPPDIWTWLLLVFIGLCGCIGHTTLNKGAQMVDASRTALLRNADIGFVLFWQLAFLHEWPTILSWLGLILISASTLFGALAKSKKPSPLTNEDVVPPEGDEEMMTIDESIEEEIEEETIA